MKVPRRSVLKALGAFWGLPVGQLLYSSIAQAQSASPPLKFIGVYVPHGVALEHYAMRAGETETTFDLNFTDCALSPFDTPADYGGRSFKSRIIILEGVDLAVAEVSGTPGHGAASCLFTGSTTTGNDHGAQGQSIDQFLARTQGLGVATAYPTLNLGVGSDGSDNQDAIAHGPGGAAIRNQLDPVKVFDQLFGNLTGTDATGAARRKGQSVIDFVRGDLNALSGRLAAPEKLKLDQHLSGLRDIETRLNATPSVATCSPPIRPQATGNTDPALDFPKLLKWNDGEPYFDRISDLQVDLLAQAIACGQTRFATLLLQDPGKILAVDGTSLPKDVHNEVAHRYSTSDATTQFNLSRLNRYYFKKVARLLQRLDEGGVLDSTLVLVGSDMGDPSLHSTRNIPMVLAGGANGQLAFGRRLKAVPDCPPGNPYCNSPALTSHAKVLVSVCKLFGVQTDTFGVAADAALITGGFPGL